MPPLFKTLIVLAAILLVMMTTIYVAQDYIVYGTLFSWDSANVTPADYGITKFESVRLKSVDGTLIKSFWLPTDKSEASKVPTIIMYHGIATNMHDYIPTAKRLLEAKDSNILMVSYRGYGTNEGYPCEHGIQLDAQAALDYLYTYRSTEIDTSKIVVFGHSLGGAVAIDLAARSKNRQRVAGLIVENSFLSIARLIEHQAPSLAWINPFLLSTWNSELNMKSMCYKQTKQRREHFVRPPKMLFLSGDKDKIVPPEHMVQLYTIAKHSPDVPNTDVHFFSFKGYGHGNTCMAVDYFKRLAEFLDTI